MDGDPICMRLLCCGMRTAMSTREHRVWIPNWTSAVDAHDRPVVFVSFLVRVFIGLNQNLTINIGMTSSDHHYDRRVTSSSESAQKLSRVLPSD